MGSLKKAFVMSLPRVIADGPRAGHVQRLTRDLVGALPVNTRTGAPLATFVWTQ